jgi:pimeloyl-ACP methyl ester carboxylesterase
MGAEDHLFLAPVKKLVENDDSSKLLVVENCGHVVNIENHLVFNKLSIQFIQNHEN